MSKNKSQTWRFKGPLRLLQQRAFLLAAIRQFFAHKGLLEVETPVLASAANTDVQIEVFASQAINDRGHSYLRTSPEFFHKRLLSSGAGDLFEIAKVFRRGERTQLHNQEFTLLEWYRLDFQMFDLIEEVIELVQFLRLKMGEPELAIQSVSYQALFKQRAGFDPFDISLTALQQHCQKQGYAGSELSRTEALDFIFSIVIQPQLAAGQTRLEAADQSFSKDQPAAGLMIYDFPIEMAALAQAHPELSDRCLRFEFLWQGVELANGYQELTDANEQLKRFQQDNKTRLQQGKAALPIDQNLIAALTAGMPACSGVALGVERLMMCLLGYSSIDQVMGFVAENS